MLEYFSNRETFIINLITFFQEKLDNDELSQYIKKTKHLEDESIQK
jgi:hypothetical protein